MRNYCFVFTDVPHISSSGNFWEFARLSVVIDCNKKAAYVYAETLGEAHRKLSECYGFSFSDLPSDVQRAHLALPAYDGPLKAT